MTWRAKMYQRFATLIAARRQAPSNDGLWRMIASTVDGESLDTTALCDERNHTLVGGAGGVSGDRLGDTAGV